MNEGGPHRAVMQQPAPRPAQLGGISSPGWQVSADSVAPTVPQLRHPESFISCKKPISAGSGGPPKPLAPLPPPMPRPVRRERVPGGLALDGIERLGTEAPARRSWRDLLYRYARIDLGPSRAAAYESDLRDQISATVGGAFSISVLNLKGGVGKTAVVEALGSTFASVRNDRVIAVDIDAGDLADRHGRRNPLNLVDLLLDGSVARYADVRAHTYMNSSGLEVLGLPDYAHSQWSIGRRDFVKAFSILRNHYSMVLVDCPKALKSGVMEAVLPESRALVVVTSTSLDAIHKTRTTLEWLTNNGYRKLVESAVLVVNHLERTKLDTLAAKELEQLNVHVAATVMLPFDRHVHKGKEIGLDRLSAESRRCYLELAAALAGLFPSR